MFENGRRSAISSSELGLYSDRTDRYSTSKYGSVVKKFVIVVMAIVTVILAAIFIYDFASGASTSSKVSQETKHIYILQNALKKSSNYSKRITTRITTTTTIPPTSPLSNPDSERLTATNIEHRSDDDDVETLSFIDTPKIADEKGESLELDASEPRAQSLENFKLKKKLLESANRDDVDEEEMESKQLFNNHAVVYRVRQMYQHGETEDEDPPEESKPAPFHFKLKNPTPASFKRLKFPQLTQYRYPHNSRNIQEIIKYLTNEPKNLKRGIKFTGVYVNPKKYDFYSNIDGNSEKSGLSINGEEENAEESESSSFSIIHNDPFYPYKPHHPADVNLLAPNNLRFSPSGLTRYNPYHESYMKRPFMMRPPLQSLPPPPSLSIESSYDNAAAYSGNYGKKRKAKPFSVMLDIYPITEINEQSSNTRVSRYKPASSDYSEDYSPDPRKPFTHNRGTRLYGSQTQPIPVVAIPANQPGISEEDERQQMVFHLNLYPRKKNKFTRKDILQRSEMINPEDQEEFMKNIMLPFDAITKQLTDHSAIEESKGEDIGGESTDSQFSKYEESILEMPDEVIDRNQDILSNDKGNMNHISVEKTDQSTTESFKENETKDITSYEGFQKFADGLIAMD